MTTAAVLGGLIAGLAAGAVSAGVSRLAADAGVRKLTPRWTRTNHAGDPVTLLEGPAAVLGTMVGLLADPTLAGRTRLAIAVAGATAGAVGAYDDQSSSQQAKGFRGHLTALAAGRLTSGTIKIIGVGAGALAAAAVLARGRAASPTGRVADVLIDVTVDAVTIAGTANLVNLLDLRPGRAVKAVGLLALPGLGHGSAAVLGAVLGVAPVDLGARGMLGDCGANGFGASAATAAMAAMPRPARLVALAGVAALNLASERVSFTQVIERTPWLDRLDRLGR